MSSYFANIFIAVFTGLLTYLGTATKIKVDKKKSYAEADDIVVQAATKVVDLLRTELARLTKDQIDMRTELNKKDERLDELSRQNRQLVNHLFDLEKAVRDLGGNVPDRPY